MSPNVMFVVPALNGGGAERVMISIANRLIKDGRKVCFILTKSQQIDYELNPQIEVTINNKNKNPLGQIRFIREQIMKHKSHTIISFFTFQNLYTLIARRGINSKLIISERNDPSKTVPNRIIDAIRVFLYKTADVIVFQTDDAKSYFNKVIQSKGVIIPNPIKENLPKPYEGERKKKLVAFSRLNKQKNIPMMLEACSEVFKKHPQYCLEIYGVGEEENALKQHAKSLGIMNQVHFKGFSSTIHEAIIDATVYISTSDYEGISNSMLEAMAIGLPCVCTDCPVGGARMFIKTFENGILVPVRDTEHTVKAICKVIEDSELSNMLSKNAVRIREQLSMDIIFKQWISLID